MCEQARTRSKKYCKRYTKDTEYDCKVKRNENLTKPSGYKQLMF
jgi:hypothetical protein